jgi:hypothetical protein
MMWDMHNHTTEEQAKSNKEKQDASSIDRASDRFTGQVHRGQGSEE